MARHHTPMVPPKAIRPLGTLHLTLGVMSLLTPDRIHSALDLLHSIDFVRLLQQTSGSLDADTINADAIAGAVDAKDWYEKKDDLKRAIASTESNAHQVSDPALIIQLSGLHPMHSPSLTSILYLSPVDPTSRLYPFCLALCKTFTEAGFLVPESRTLRLHATIVNTIYAKDRGERKSGGGHGKDRRGVTSLDAEELIGRYEGFVWADGLRLDRVSICEMGAKKVEKDGEVEEEYLEIGSVPLP